MLHNKEAEYCHQMCFWKGKCTHNELPARALSLCPRPHCGRGAGSGLHCSRKIPSMD